MGVNSLLGAKYCGIKQEQVCVGNGAAELIKSLMARIQGQIGVIYPTFEEYPNRREKESIVAFVPSNKDFRYTADELIAFFDGKQIEALLLINPDNPSGNFISKERVLSLAEWCTNQSIRLVVDESFVDFSDNYAQNTLLENDLLERYPTMVVMKSISKSYGVPGLRLGIMASADKELIDATKKDVAIWNINSFAEFYMQIFGKYEGDYLKACEKFIAERNRFYTALQQVKFLRVIPSQANYFLCEVTGKYTASELTRILLEKANILIKDCSSKCAFSGKQYVRIAIRNQQDNDKLATALITLSL